MPKKYNCTKGHQVFEKYNVEKQIEQGLQSKVYLHSGGSIVIETTEAMTVIDVNTGRFIGHTNLEDTILKTNLEAAEEIRTPTEITQYWRPHSNRLY